MSYTNRGHQNMTPEDIRKRDLRILHNNGVKKYGSEEAYDQELNRRKVEREQYRAAQAAGEFVPVKSGRKRKQTSPKIVPVMLHTFFNDEEEVTVPAQGPATPTQGPAAQTQGPVAPAKNPNSKVSWADMMEEEEEEENARIEREEEERQRRICNKSQMCCCCSGMICEASSDYCNCSFRCDCPESEEECDDN